MNDAESEENSLLSSLIAPLKNDVNLSDMTILCGGHEFPAHQLVLSAGSPYFQSVLRKHHEETGRQHVSLLLPDSVTPETLQVILDFLYTGQTPDGAEDQTFLQSIVEASHFLKVDELFTYYLHRLAKQLSANDVKGLVHLVSQYRDDVLAVDLVSHLSNKFCHIHKRKDFLNLTVYELVTILQNLNTYNVWVGELRRALLAWRKFEESRKDDFDKAVSACIFKYSSSEMKLALFGAKDCVPNENPAVISSEYTGLLEQKSKDVTVDGDQKLLFFYKHNGQDLVRYYDIDRDSWSGTELLPFSLLHGSAIIDFEKHVYFLGGSTSMRKGGSAEVTVYCPSTNTSVPVGGLSFPVAFASAAVYRKSIYVVGGKNWLNHLSPSHQVQCFNPVTGECRELARTYMDNCKCEVFVCEGFLYVVNLDVHSTCVERYNYEVNQWTVVSEANFDYTLNPLNSAFIGHELFLFVDSILNEFLVFDTSTNAWNFIKGMGYYRFIREMWPVIIKGRPVILACTAKNFHTFDIQSRVWETRPSVGVLAPSGCGSVIMKVNRQYQSQLKPTNHLMMSLNAMRTNSVYTDVVLVCSENCQLSAHRLVLTTASPYFLSMFSSGLQEAQSGIVNLPTISYDVMDIAIGYLYTGKLKDVDLDYQLLIELLEIAHLMLVPRLVNLCLLKLCKQINTDNYQQLYYLANLYNPLFESHIGTFAVRNLQNIIQREDFKDLCVPLLNRILLHPELWNQASLDLFWEAALAWLQADLCRFAHAEHVFSASQLRYISSTSLSSILEHDVIQKDFKAHRRIQDELNRRKTNMVNTAKESQKVFNIGFDTESFKYVVKSYDKTEDKWRFVEFPAMFPYGATALTFGNDVYFFGGVIEGSPTAKFGGVIEGTPTTNVFQYFPFTNVATAFGDICFAVTDAGAGILHDAIYVVGGKNAKGEATNIAQRFVPSLSVCDVVKPTMACYAKPYVETFQDSLYILGATDNGDSLVETYNSILDQWTVITHIPALFDHCMFTICWNKLYFLTKGNSLLPSTVYMYDFISDAWQLVCKVTDENIVTVCQLLLGCKAISKEMLITDIRCNRLLKFYKEECANVWPHLNVKALEYEITVCVRTPECI